MDRTDRHRRIRRATCRAALGALAFFATGVAAAQGCVAPPSGMLAWYPAERSGDDAASFFNGAAAGDTAYVAGRVGEAFAFDGAGDRVGTTVTVEEMRAVRTFSYEMWARPTATLPACAESNSGACGLLPWANFPFHGDVGAPLSEAGAAAGVGIAIGTNGICVGEHSTSLVDCLARFDTAIADWTHIVVVVEGKVPRIYVDGVLRRTGVSSAKNFVFASWAILGSGLGLGEYTGGLDELAVYGRALSDAEIAGLFAAGTAGKCRGACTFDGPMDAWQGATVTATSGLSSSDGADLFGGTQSVPEPSVVLFADGQPDGTVHTIEWSTADPITLNGFALAALHEPASTQRALRHFKLEVAPAGENHLTVYESPVVLPYGAASNALRKCVNLRPKLAQQFRASFTQEGPAGFSGPRVEELDARALPDALHRDGFEDPPATDD